MSKKKIKVLIQKTINSKIQQGNIITISYGYARNYLIPQGIALIATKNIVQYSYRNQQVQKQEIIENYNKLSNVKNLIETINTFSLKKKISFNHRFFGSIVTINVIQVLLKTSGILVDKKQVHLPKIRKAGIYTITLQLSTNVIANIIIRILPLYI